MTFTQTGIILKSGNVGEGDRRVVLLLAQSGKITAFAANAAKPKSKFLGKLEPFYFGDFTVNINRNSNRLTDVNITQYFHELRTDFDAMCLGSYFLEICDKMTCEFNEDKELLKLLFVSLKALVRPDADLELIRAVFEIRASVLSGEFYFFGEKYSKLMGGTHRAIEHIIKSPFNKLYTFSLSLEVLGQVKELSKQAAKEVFGGYKKLMDFS